MVNFISIHICKLQKCDSGERKITYIQIPWPEDEHLPKNEQIFPIYPCRVMRKMEGNKDDGKV